MGVAVGEQTSNDGAETVCRRGFSPNKDSKG